MFACQYLNTCNREHLIKLGNSRIWANIHHGELCCAIHSTSATLIGSIISFSFIQCFLLSFFLEKNNCVVKAALRGCWSNYRWSESKRKNPFQSYRDSKRLSMDFASFIKSSLHQKEKKVYITCWNESLHHL